MYCEISAGIGATAVEFGVGGRDRVERWSAVRGMSTMVSGPRRVPKMASKML